MSYFKISIFLLCIILDIIQTQYKPSIGLEYCELNEILERTMIIKDKKAQCLNK